MRESERRFPAITTNDEKAALNFCVFRAFAEMKAKEQPGVIFNCTSCDTLSVQFDEGNNMFRVKGVCTKK